MPQTFHLQSHPFHAAAAVSLDPQTEPTFVKLFTLISAKQRTAWHIQNLAVVPQYAYTYYITTCVQHVGSRFKSKSTIQNLMYVATVVQVQISGLYIYIYVHTVHWNHTECGSISINYIPAQCQPIFTFVQNRGAKTTRKCLAYWRTASMVYNPWMRLIHSSLTMASRLSTWWHDNFGSLWNSMVSTCLNMSQQSLPWPPHQIRCCQVLLSQTTNAWATKCYPNVHCANQFRVENSKTILKPEALTMAPCHAAQTKVTVCLVRRVMWQKHKLLCLRRAVDCWGK